MTIQTTPKKIYRVTQPEWSKQAVIYQVNTRQFSVSGTFKEVTKRLNHICDLGADIPVSYTHLTLPTICSV